jgi:hypothetical protein
MEDNIPDRNRVPDEAGLIAIAIAIAIGIEKVNFLRKHR